MSKSWQGDWHARIMSRVRQRGFDTVRQFVASLPQKSWLKLADELGPAVAAIQLRVLAYEEARQRNEVVSFAKDCAVRDLREWIPAGWSKGDSFLVALGSARGASISSLEDSYLEHAERAWDWLGARDIPEGWLPAGPDDPWIEAMFRETGFPGADKTDKPSL